MRLRLQDCSAALCNSFLAEQLFGGRFNGTCLACVKHQYLRLEGLQHNWRRTYILQPQAEEVVIVRNSQRQSQPMHASREVKHVRCCLGS